jgi:hypothetical protein
MSDHASNVSIGFALKKLNLDQFAILENAYSVDRDTGLVTGLQFAADAANKRIKCSVRISFEQDEHPFLVFESSNDFSVDKETWLSFENEEKKIVVFPKKFIAHLAMLTVGTARGMLHVKTENTKFNQYFIPTINVAEMINDDVSFDV